MSEFKIAKGIGFPPHMLKDAEFSKATEGGKIYCYIITPDEVKHAFTSREALRLSNRGGKHLTHFRKWLEEQDDPIRRRSDND